VRAGWLRVGRIVVVLAVWAGLSAGVAVARDPVPTLRIPLEPMGYQTMQAEFLATGSSMVTVNFVDDTHLLVSFALRRLMKREVDDPPNDSDRTVGAFLVELPSGKVLAKTEWRLHDHGQYLWALGHGRFLLRVRDRLTMIAPMAGEKPEQDAFREFPFLRMDRHVLAVLLSADDDLLTVETTEQTAAGDAEQANAMVQINFYRLTVTATEPDKMLVSSAGVLRARVALALPLTTAGFIEVLEGGRDRWLFNFDTPGGKVSELAQFDTTCFPRTTFVSRSEFVAFGCRGTIDKQDIAGFNLKGDAMWQQNFFDTQVAATFAFAPKGGRFALQRTITGGTPDPMASITGVAGMSSQEVRVYQSYNGKLLFQMACRPAVRAGQNFALSQDGMRVAMLHETMTDHKGTKDFEAYTSKTVAVEIYELPELTAKDEAAVKEAQGFAPADTGAPVAMALQRVTGQAAAAAAMPEATADSAGAVSGPGTTPAETTNSSTALGDPAPPVGPAGDEVPTTPRKPPTLYGPGEKPSK
jgi:uncharacterized protein YkuJ